MQIKNRLTLLFTSLAAVILLIFAVTIYLTSAETREDEYFNRLKQQASTKASLLLDSHVSPAVLQLIYKKTPNSLFQEEMAIYDTAFNLRYHDAVEKDNVKETKEMIDSIVRLKEIHFYVKDLQVDGFLFEHNNRHYVITAAAKDEYGLNKLRTLRNTLLIVFFGSLIIIFLVGRFLAQQSLLPVSKIVGQVKNITVTNLDLRVDEGNRKDEIAALAITFNEMLRRLEDSFDAQKQFVSNISHELRTPLTAMLAELQLTAQRPRTVEEYQATNKHIIADTQKLIRLISSLLDFAKANYDQTEISLKEIRLDEILIDARNDVLHDYPDYNIDIGFQKEIENDDFISVTGNEYLLKRAFINLMENGCKFSGNKQTQVTINYDTRYTIISFTDHGIGIAEEDLQKIFLPFYRGANRQYIDGSGIGLSLVNKIVQLHNGTTGVTSVKDEGTTFTVTIPHV